MGKRKKKKSNIPLKKKYSETVVAAIISCIAVISAAFITASPVIFSKKIETTRASTEIPPISISCVATNNSSNLNNILSSGPSNEYRVHRDVCEHCHQFNIPTKAGEIFDEHAIKSEHPTMPLPKYATITNIETDDSRTIRINQNDELRIISLKRKFKALL